MHYEIVNGDYLLKDGDQLVYNMGKEIAISYTYDFVDEKVEATIFKHGHPEMVKAAHEDFLTKMNLFNEMLKSDQPKHFFNGILPIKEFDLTTQFLIKGKFDVEDLNKMIEISGHVGVIHRKIMH